MNDKHYFFSIFLFVFLFACRPENEPKLIYSNSAYSLYDNEIKQGDFTATAVSPIHIVSDYKSISEQRSPRHIHFKFSINSRDNELPIGKEHILSLDQLKDTLISPIIRFGEVQETTIEKTETDSTATSDSIRLTLRVDMSEMIDAFKTEGKYTTPTGDVIHQNDFKGVYVAGDLLPLTWDFENLYNKPGQKLTDPDNDNIYEITLYLRPTTSQTPSSREWKLTGSIGRYPQYQSGQLIIDALYNLALEELQDIIRPDSTFRAGAAWDGVWTRDISYSIYLAMAYLAPEIAQKSLMAKVNDMRIVQDTGTGGAWPVSSDRVVWSLAAWELYKTTGDRDWLKYAYTVIKNTASDDFHTVRDPRTNLMHGEQSYLDWREQSYPRWMQPVDIYQSFCLGTNVLHYQMYMVLARMAYELNDKIEPYEHQAILIKKAIQRHFWMPEKGYFGQYLYGGIFPILSPGIDNLGESLAILFDVATYKQAYQITSSVPITDFGTTSIYPQIPHIKPYHNNAIWPFVQAYWNLAAAKANNELAVLHGVSALYRAAALFVTHQELFVASTGDYSGTAINSDKMLWSIAGNIAMIYRLYFGMQFETYGIRFTPYVPTALSGPKTITGFKYRNADLTIKLSGSGNNIKAFYIDGKISTEPVFPADLTGEHQVEIELGNEVLPASSIHLLPVEEKPEATVLEKEKETPTVLIENYSPDNLYQLYQNGEAIQQLNIGKIRFDVPSTYKEIAITPINKNGWTGFTGKPVIFIPKKDEILIEIERFATPIAREYAGYSGQGYINISPKLNQRIDIPVVLSQNGTYAIDIKYANGSGPINTQNKCAIRSLFINEKRAGAIVMPQRGENEWSNWGYSSPIVQPMKKGNNVISILYITPQDVNMNGEINDALIDAIRLRKISE